MRFELLGWVVTCAVVGGCANAGSQHVPAGGAKVDSGTTKSDSPSDLSGFGEFTGDMATPITPKGCIVAGVAGSFDAQSGKCVYRICANNAECTAKAAPITGIGARPIDGRFPVAATITNVSNVTATYPAVSVPNATNLCAHYGAEYWAHTRRADVPNCGADYGMARASNSTGGFSAQEFPLCALAYASVPNNSSGVPDSAFQVTGIPIIDSVWCKKAPDTTGADNGIVPPAFNSFNALPFDTDPHDNNDPRYVGQPVDPGSGGGA